MVPFWAYTELSSAPILASVYFVATLVQRMLFIALMTASQVSPNLFLPSEWLLANVQVNITSYTWYTAHIFYTSHSCIHTFIFTWLLFFVAGWLPLTLDVRYKYVRGKNHLTHWGGGGLLVLHFLKDFCSSKNYEGKKFTFKICEISEKRKFSFFAVNNFYDKMS